VKDLFSTGWHFLEPRGFMPRVIFPWSFRYNMEAIAQSLWTGVIPEGGVDEADTGLVLGLDFGSSNSSVSVWRGDKNKVKIIRNLSKEGNQNQGMPSV
jgi:hypothetical protein